MHGASRPEHEELEALPAVGGARQPAPTPPPIAVEELEELPAVHDAAATGPAAAGAARLSVYTVRELADLSAAGLPAVAAEGGVFRVQAHAYGGAAGRDPGLRQLAAAVLGGPGRERPADRGRPPRRQDGAPLRMLACGIDLDALRAAAVPADHEAQPFRAVLRRLCHRTDALGAALLVRDRSGGYRPRQVTGILRRSAARLAFAHGDPVAVRYLGRRVALIAAGQVPGVHDRFAAAARERVGRLALLPAWAERRPAYLLLTAAEGDGAWDGRALMLRLQVTAAAPPPPCSPDSP